MSEFQILSDLFLVRPQWLWLLLINIVFLIPIILQNIHKIKSSNLTNNHSIDPEFLKHLTEHRSKRSKTATRLPLFLLLNMAIITATGPGFRSIEIDQEQQVQPLVILFDQSVSMMATDISPNRHTQSLRFINNLLKNNSDVPVSVYVYAGSTHRLTPITQDHATIDYLLEQSDAWSMPQFGSNAQQAIKVALKDLDKNGITDARLLLITDELLGDDLLYLSEFNTLPLDIYWTGSELGAPIIYPENHRNSGNYVRDQNNVMVMATTNIGQIQALANTNIRVSNINLNTNIDLKNDVFESDKNAAQRTLKIKEDAGFMLIPFLLILFLLAYRKTNLKLFTPLFAVIMLMPLLSNQAKAENWFDSVSNTFLNDSQKAQKFAQENDYKNAAELNPDFSAFSEFQQGNVDKAIEQFSSPVNALDFHNLGTSQLKAEKFEDAVKNLKKAVELNPEQSLSEQYLEYAEQALAKQKEEQQEGENNEEGDSKNEETDQQKEKSEDGEKSDEESQDGEKSESEEDGEPSDQQSNKPSDQKADNQELQQQDDMKQEMQQNNQDKAEQQDTESAMNEKPAEELSDEEKEALAKQLAEQQKWDKEQQELDELLNQVPESNIDFMANKFHRQLQQQPQQYEGQPW
jgi:Ca-activated chloride channel homolog